MIIDANEVAADGTRTERADVVIVGAGTVGLLLAEVLAQAGRTVILLEAGDRVAAARQDAHGAKSIGRPHAGVHAGRAFGLGGTSALWGGQLVEFESADLSQEERPWPLSYDEVSAWYRRAYEILGQPAEADFDSGGPERQTARPKDPNVEIFYTRWLSRPNFAVLFRGALLDNERITTYIGAVAHNIDLDARRATVVTARTRGGRNLRFAADAFVFAAGTIGNAQFFLTTQRANVPWSRSTAIGRNFQDHLGVEAAKIHVRDDRRFRQLFENGFCGRIKIQPKLRPTAALRNRLASGVCGIIEFRSDVGLQIAQFKQLLRSVRSGVSLSSLSQLPASAWQVGGSLLPLAWRYARDRRILAFYDRGVRLQLQAEQRPIFDSAIVTADPEPLASGLLPVAVDWRVDGREITAMRDFALQCQRFFEAQGLARLELDARLLAGDVAFLETASDTYHQCGGLCMSIGPQTGATDRDGRIWGTDNVYIAGASTFPSSSYANCTLTALALALRLGDGLGRERSAR